MSYHNTELNSEMMSYINAILNNNDKSSLFKPTVIKDTSLGDVYINAIYLKDGISFQIYIGSINSDNVFICSSDRPFHKIVLA